MRSLNSDQMLSIAAPVHNEAACIEQFAEEVRAQFEKMQLGACHEIVLVNDGSEDGTDEKLDALAARYPGEIRAVHLSRRYGFTAAVSAALAHARGDVVILMDADMQDDPAAFGAFLEKWREGCDIVYAIRTGRRESAAVRLLTWGFYRLLRVMSQFPIPLDAGTYALMDRRAVDALLALPERNRYIPGLRCWIGFRQAGMLVDRRPRSKGHSRVGIRGLWDLAIMALFSFSFMPLLLFRLAGFFAIGVAGLVMLLSLIGIPFGFWPGTVAAILFLVAFFGGINLLGIGILGEYTALIYDEVRQRPLYMVDRITGGEKSGEDA
jgi:polyisoprenyl-phosphate glycosyltransferase